MNAQFEKNLELGKKLFEEDINGIASRIFMEECTACGGNWVAMLWTGFKRYHENGSLTDEEFELLDKLSNELEGGAGVAEFSFLAKMGALLVIREQLRLTKWGEQYLKEKSSTK